MTPAQYRTMRQRIGTQEHVAKLLGISRVTIAKREAGAAGWPISREAALAMRSLTPAQAKSMVAARERRKSKS